MNLRPLVQGFYILDVLHLINQVDGAKNEKIFSRSNLVKAKPKQTNI